MYVGFALTVVAVCVAPLSAQVRGQRGSQGTGQGPRADSTAECNDKALDIYFLLDSSSSMSPSDFVTLQDFVVTFVRRLDLRPGVARVGLGVFSDDFVHQFSLGDYPGYRELEAAIRMAPHRTGNTYTGKGLRGMRTWGFPEDLLRRNVTKVGVVITDGRSRHRTKTAAEGRLAMADDIWLLAIGVGRSVDTAELSLFASDSKQDFVLHVPSFRALAAHVPALTSTVCSIRAPLAVDDAKCGQRKKADIMFVYNAAAMSARNVTTVNNFTKYVIDNFSMTSGNIRVGVISEGRQGGDIDLSQSTTRDEFIRALSRQREPQLTPLLKKARLQGFDPARGSRRDATKIVAIFLDDAQVSTEALLEARKLIYDNVLVYVIAVGVGANEGQVRQLVSSQDQVDTIFGSFAALYEAPKRERFITRFCNAAGI